MIWSGSFYFPVRKHSIETVLWCGRRASFARLFVGSVCWILTVWVVFPPQIMMCFRFVWNKRLSVNSSGIYRGRIVSASVKSIDQADKVSVEKSNAGCFVWCTFQGCFNLNPVLFSHFPCVSFGQVWTQFLCCGYNSVEKTVGKCNPLKPNNPCRYCSISTTCDKKWIL